MKIAQLETMIWISRLGSVRKAASQLGTSQPAASARIRELEEHLGISLFLRDKRPMRVSPQGREIVRLAERIVALVEKMEEYANASQPIYGAVKLGANHAVAASWLPKLLKLAQERLPGVELELVVELTEHLTDMLRRGELDMAFVIGRPADKAIGYSRLYDVGIDWVAHKRVEGVPSIITPQRIARFAILTDSVGSPVHQSVMNWFQAANVQPRRIDICSGPAPRLNLAAEGEWLVAMPAIALSQYPRAAEFAVYPSKPVLDPMEFGVAHRLASDNGPTLQLMLKICREVVSLWEASGRAPLA